MIGIVGGGVSGLFLLHLLTESGQDAVLFEGGDLPGGVMKSRATEGPNGPVIVDLGPQRIRLTPGIASICDQLKLSGSLLRAPSGVPFMMYHGGRLHSAPLSISDALRTRLVSTGGKVRALADLVTPPPRAGESVAHALTRKLGPQVYRRLAGPLFGGLYASDPEQMDARHTLLPVLRRTGARRSLLLGLIRAARWQRAPVVSFREGLGALPLALARQHRDRIRLADPVHTVSPTPTGEYRIQSEGGRQEVNQVVLALPAPEAAAVLAGSHPVLAGAMASLRYNRLAIVPLVVPSASPTPRIGSGFKMTLDDPSATRGVTAHDRLFQRPGLFTAFLGGMGSEDIVDLPDSDLMARARADFERVTGATATALFAHRTWMPAWDRSWAVLDELSLPKGLHLCAAFSQRPGIVGRLEDARSLAARLGIGPKAPTGAS